MMTLFPSDYISNIPLYLSVLHLLRRAPLIVRHTICHQVISLLHLNSYHIDDIASHPGWESLFLWLLCTPDTKGDVKSTENHFTTNTDEICVPVNQDNPSSCQIEGLSMLNWLNVCYEDDDICRTFAVVTETIGYILWHLSSKENQGVWLTWGCIFASLDMFAKIHSLIVPDHIIKQR